MRSLFCSSYGSVKINYPSVKREGEKKKRGKAMTSLRPLLVRFDFIRTSFTLRLYNLDFYE